MSWSGRKAAVLLFMVAVLQWPAVASADDAGAMLAEGLVRLRLGKFRQALKVLKGASRKTSDPTTKAQIHLNMGLVYVVLRKKRKARRHFITALRLDPSVTLKRGEVKEKVVTMLEKIRAKIKGTLVVKADMPGARVLVDGKEAGKAPLRALLSVGKYRVQVVSPDELFRLEAVVVVRSDDETRVQGKLEFIGCKLDVTSNPPGARVLVDGKELGLTPLSGAGIKVGEHKVRVVREGSKPHLARIIGERGGSIALSVTLKPISRTPSPVPATRPASAPTPPAVKPTVKRRFPMWTIITAGAALAAAGAGVGLGLATKSAYEDYEQTTRQGEYWDLRDQVTSLQAGANISFAVAGALALGAAAVYLFWERHPLEAEQPVSPGVSPQKAPATTWRVLPSPGGLVVQF